MWKKYFVKCKEHKLEYKNIKGVPDFMATEYEEKKSDYVVLIPIINEGERIHKELMRAKKYQVYKSADIVICDGDSSDGSTQDEKMKKLNVNTMLVKKGAGKQGAQLRMGIWWALKRGYKGIITIDGNNKDSVEDVPFFINKLKEGYAFVQGSRFVKGGKAVNTPLLRLISIKLLHAPIISLTARHKFTDTTNAFRGYSAEYLSDNRVSPLRDVFVSYELLAYLSVRATQLGYKVCEIPVSRIYPKNEKTPTKISFFKGNGQLMKILLANLFGKYHP